MQNLAKNDRGRIRELDGWRGVSILLVVLHHSLILAFPATLEHVSQLHHVLFYAGEFGVRIFFVISGFVITRLLIAEERQNGRISLKSFYTRRFFRIIPVFYCFILTTLILSRCGWTPTSGSATLVTALFLHNLNFNVFDWFFGHSWTLAVEEQFYIVFPFFWLLTPPRRRAPLLFGALAVFLAWSSLMQWNILDSVTSLSTVAGFSCINVGVLLAIFEPQARALAARFSPLLVVAIAVLFFIHPVHGSRAGEGIYSITMPFAVALMLTHTMERKGWIASLLKTPAFQWCGLISYSAYLWQELFTGSEGFYGSQSAARAFHLALLILPLIAAASFYWIERPSSRLGRRISAQMNSRKKSQAATLTS
jgi:peptidoglycan/LPS O-acetylase OafA/YrhL